MKAQTTPKTKTVKHSCGHESRVEIDAATVGWAASWQAQPCVECQPTVEVRRACGHTEALQRFFGSPRRMEIAEQVECSACQARW